MWRWVILIVAIVCLSGGIAYFVNTMPVETDSRGVPFAAPEAPSGPVGKLVVEGGTEFDFGRTATYKEGKHDFEIKNVGEGELVLKPGTTTCQCTVLNFDPKRKGNASGQIALKPGESTTISVGWTPKNAGKFKQGASILSNDPAQPEVSFVITGTAYPPIVTQPEQPVFELPSIDNDKEMSMYLAVSSFDEPNFKITEITSTSPELITATQQPLSETEKRELKFETGYKVEIKLHPSRELGPFNAMVVVKTDHTGSNEVQVPIRGRRTGAISAPELVRFNATQAAGGHNASLILVRGQENTQFQVESKPKGIDVRIEAAPGAKPNDKLRKYTLITDVPAGAPADMIDGELVLKTDHPTVSVLKIPVKVPVVGSN